MKVNGSCHCGAIAFEAELDPAGAFVCHCDDCQTISGSAFRVSVPAAAEHFAITRGTPKVYVKTAESGTRRAQGFCGACATAIYSADVENAKSYMLRLGSIQQRADIIPQAQSWCSSAQPWTQDLGALPAHQKGMIRK